MPDSTTAQLRDEIRQLRERLKELETAGAERLRTEELLRVSEARGRAYRSTGVPAIIVNGKYRIEGKMAGSNTNMLRVTDFLIQKEREAMASVASKSSASE